MKRPLSRIQLFLIIVCALLVTACSSSTPWGTIYGSAVDERSVDQQADDKRISLTIKADMADRDSGKALKIHVYCFVGRVYLVGAIDDTAFRSFAVSTANKTEGVKSVTTHFVGETDTLTEDLEIAATVRADLIAHSELSSTQIETETMNGEVVLLGMVRSKADARLAVKIAGEVEGVRKVTSYLIPTR